MKSATERPGLVILARDHVRELVNGADAPRTLRSEPAELVASVKALLRIDRAEVELRESQERYRRIIDTALEGVWTIDAGGITTYVNRRMAALLGQSVADMIGRPLGDFMERKARGETERNFEHARRGVKEQFEARFQIADGRALWVMVSTHPILAEDGQFAGALILIIDVTSRERAESAKREAETLGWVAALAAAVSHEINNPLMCVMGNLQLLEGTEALDAYGRRRLEAALIAAAEIKEKVRRLGRITRVEIAADGPMLPPMLDLVKSSQGLDDAEC